MAWVCNNLKASFMVVSMQLLFASVFVDGRFLTVKRIAAGISGHACVQFNENRKIKCFGENKQDEALGLGIPDDAIGDDKLEMGDYLPFVDLGSQEEEIIKLSVGNGFSCALYEDGGVKCWGYSASGRLGIGDGFSRGRLTTDMGDDLPFVFTGPLEDGKVVDISLGYNHVVILFENGGIKSWGYPDDGLLGTPESFFGRDFFFEAVGGECEDMVNLPFVDVGNTNEIKPIQVSSGKEHTCVLFDNGKIKCYGKGVLGYGDEETRGDDSSGEMGDDLLFVPLFQKQDCRAQQPTCTNGVDLKGWFFEDINGEFGPEYNCEFLKRDDDCDGTGFFPISNRPSVKFDGLTGQEACQCSCEQTPEPTNRPTNAPIPTPEPTNRPTNAPIPTPEPTPNPTPAPVVCTDDPVGWFDADGPDFGCTNFYSLSNNCEQYGHAFRDPTHNKVANEACCVCGGGIRPAPAPTSASPTINPTSASPTINPTSASPTSSPSTIPSVSPTATNYPTSSPSDSPTEAPSFEALDHIPAIQVASGAEHTCVLFENGKVKCFGRNFFGQLGLGDTYPRGSSKGEMGNCLPYVDLGATAGLVTQISTSDYHTCALFENGKIKCWGLNIDGQLGYADTNNRGDEPFEMGENLTFVDTGSALGDSCFHFATAEPTLPTPSPTPICVDDPKDWHDADGPSYDCSWYASEVNYCSDYGHGLRDPIHNKVANEACCACGGGLSTPSPTTFGPTGSPAVLMQSSSSIIQVATGERYTLVLFENGQMKGFGRNLHGQLGYEDTSNRGDESFEMGVNLKCIDLGTEAFVGLTPSPTVHEEFEENGACIFDTESEDPGSKFEGSFENSKPWARNYHERVDSASMTRGCICKEDEIFDFSDVRYGNEFHPDDIGCFFSCRDAKEQFGFLPGSKSFMTTPSDAFAFGIFTIIGDVATVDRPNLRFQFGYGELSGGRFHYLEVSVIFLAKNVNEQVLVYSAGTGQPHNIKKARCKIGNVATCKNSWSRYTISLLPALKSSAFKKNGRTFKDSFISIAFRGEPLTFFALDNVELVGPPVTNSQFEEEIVDLQVESSYESLPDVEISLLGDDPVANFFTVLVISCLGAYTVATFMILCIRRVGKFHTQLSVMSWTVLSTVISIYAIVSFLGFVEELGDLETQSDQVVNELQATVTRPDFDSRRLSDIIQSENFFGAFLFALPPFDREKLNKVFEFVDGSEDACSKSRITSGDCLGSEQLFFDTVDLPPNATFRPDFYRGLLIEGTINTSQDHFVKYLLVSLTSDIVISQILLLAIVFHLSYKQKYSRFQEVVEVVFCIFNLAIIVILAEIAFNEPIRYTISMNIVDLASGSGIQIQPIDGVLKASIDGELLLDTTSLNVSEEVFSEDGFDTAQTYLEGITLALDKELVSTINSPTQACNWGDITQQSNPDGSIIVTIDCSEGSLKLVPKESVAPLYNFVWASIILGTVFIDFVISIVDILVLIQVVYLRRLIMKLEKEPQQKDNPVVEDVELDRIKGQIKSYKEWKTRQKSTTSAKDAVIDPDDDH